jgi:hypothetical protein
MVDDDLQSHLDDMAKTFERLSSLITADSPLTPEDIYSASILSSLPSDWLSCVSSMMNEPRIQPSKLIDALKAEGLRRKTRSEETTLVESSSAAKTKPATSKPNSNPGGPPARHCTFCNVPGHDLNRCRNVAKLISAHKSSQTPSTPATADSNRNQSNGRRPPQPPAKAGRTSATPLVPFGTAEDEESDFLGSELEVTAGQAAVSLSSTLAAIPSGDANLDSGCSVSMTPDLSSVVLAKTNRTPV